MSANIRKGSFFSDYKIHEASLTTVVYNKVNLGHTDSQSEKTKAGAANPASTNRRFTNWEMKNA